MTKVWDNTGLQRLSGSDLNPTPTLSSITPNYAYEGESSQVITLTGTNFIPTSQVRFDGSDIDTTYVSATSLTATIDTADLSVDGDFDVVVVNPSPGGGASSAQTFTVREADPYFDDVVLLVRSVDAVDGQSTFVDESSVGRTLTANGGVIYDDGESLYGDASILFDGTGDFISMSSAADLQIAVRTVDFCMEFWIYVTQSKFQAMFNKRDGGGAEEYSAYTSGAGNYCGLSIFDSGSPEVETNSSSGTPGGGTLPNGEWVHVAHDRRTVAGTTTLRTFIGGTLYDSSTQSGNSSTNTANLRIGRDGFNSGRDFLGRMDSVRFTRGTSRYAASFTPPSLPFPPI